MTQHNANDASPLAGQMVTDLVYSSCPVHHSTYTGHHRYTICHQTLCLCTLFHPSISRSHVNIPVEHMNSDIPWCRVFPAAFDIHLCQFISIPGLFYPPSPMYPNCPKFAPSYLICMFVGVIISIYMLVLCMGCREGGGWFCVCVRCGVYARTCTSPHTHDRVVRKRQTDRKFAYSVV